MTNGGRSACPTCGSFVESDAEFCPNCGIRLKRTSIWEDMGRGLAVAFFGFVALLFGAAGACLLLVGSGGSVWAILIGGGLLVIAWAAFKAAQGTGGPRPAPRP